MQDLIVLRNGQVVVQSNDKVYQETLENFVADYGESIGDVQSIDYNRDMKTNIVEDGVLGSFPVELYENILDSINALLTAKEVREHVEPTAEEKLEAAKAQAEATIREKLDETDYKCLKFVDGELTAEEYAETKAERQRLRKLFNVVEACETLADVQSITNNI